MLISQGQQIHPLILKSGLDSNVFANNSLINLYSKCGLFKVAESLFNSLLSSDSVSCNIILAGFVNLGQLSNARKLFDVMPVKVCVSYTTMIMGLARNNFWVEAVEVFKDMGFIGVVPNEVTLGSVISAYAHLCGSGSHVGGMLRGLSDARLVFDEIGEMNIVGWNVMLNQYSKSGLVDMAGDLSERILDRDVVSWGTIIGGYVQVERLDEALTMLIQMQWKISLACLQFEQGSKDHLASWNALIAGFIRNGMINQARNLFDEMPDRDVFSWGTTIAGHAQNEEPNMDLELSLGMIDHGIRRNEVTMVSVLSAIASLGTLNEGIWAHEFESYNSIPLNDNLSAALK
ncbi:Pentatricopeptide repeat [Dillenia turbinata]|uniref:Pentatricopeptide repeat n=1 Tax=Dillenia turbinata TaxID=194707 RepID=A0AAN8UMD3_9MAGN